MDVKMDAPTTQLSACTIKVRILLRFRPSLLTLPLQSYYKNKIEQAEIAINKRTQNLRRLEAQRNALNSRVRLLREELKLLQEPGSYVGEVVKVMGKKKVLVKVQPEGKYGECHCAA